jgi:3-methyladenine DNA glycosylase AlkD
MVGETRHIEKPRGHGALRHHRTKSLRRLGGGSTHDGAPLWAGSRSRAGTLETGWYEARMMAAFVDDPALVTPAQMDRWAGDFDNWAICDTVCFHLFDKSPYAWRKIRKWSGRRDEFVKRAAFALLASVALHDKAAPADRFLEALPLVERAARDPRNFVKKGVSWALRGIGKRRDPSLKAAAIGVAERLAASEDAAARWVGKDALRDLS